jgi:hypothetical protein
MTNELAILQTRATEDVVKIVRGMFNSQHEEKSPELLQWQYLQMLGGSYVALAHSSGGPVEDPAALYTVFPVRFRIGSREAIAVQSFDTLTLEKFRGQGLFTTLAKATYSSVQSQNVDLVYGVPNSSSVAGFKTKLGWTFIDPLPMLVRPVGFRYVRVRTKLREPKLSDSRSKHRNSLIDEVQEVPDDIDQLSSRIMSESYVGVLRNSEYLNWRLRRPGSSYRLFTLRSVDGRLEAFGVYELVLKHGCCLGYVMELMQDPKHPRSGSLLLKAMTSEMKLRGADLVFAWSMPTSNAYSSFKKRAYMQFPSWLRPIELHLGFRVLNPGLPASAFNRNNWNISYLDSDTV